MDLSAEKKDRNFNREWKAIHKWGISIHQTLMEIVMCQTFQWILVFLAVKIFTETYRNHGTFTTRLIVFVLQDVF